jgi:hypothetical protein
MSHSEEGSMSIFFSGFLEGKPSQSIDVITQGAIILRLNVGSITHSRFGFRQRYTPRGRGNASNPLEWRGVTEIGKREYTQNPKKKKWNRVE